MVEPLALNVVNSLPRHSRRALSHLAKTSKRPSLAANFFTPLPRQNEGKMKAVESPPLAIILDCQAWACPRSQFSAWHDNGPMRSILLKELSPPSELSPPRRVRRTSQTSRMRFRQSTRPSASQQSSRMSLHLHYSTRASTTAAKRHAPFIPATQKAQFEDSTPGLGTPVERLRKCLRYQSSTLENLNDLSSAFRDARKEDAFVSLSPGEILELSKALADQLDGLCVDQVTPDIIQTFGRRLQQLLDHLPSSSTNSGDTIEMSLQCRASSFMQRFDQSEWFLEKIPAAYASWGDDYEPFRAAVLSFLLAKVAHNGLYECVQYLWMHNKKFSSRYFATTDQFQKLLVNTRDLVDAIQPVFKWHPKHSRPVISALIYTCNVQEAFPEAAELIDEARTRGIDLSDHDVLMTCQGLSSMYRHIGTAQRLFEALPPSESEEYTRVMLYLAGRKGDTVTARELVERRRERGLMNDADLSNALASLARHGRILEVQKLFNEYFPLGADGKRTGNPNIYHYTNAIQAHVQLGDTQGIGAWLEDMDRSEVKPNAEFFTTLMTIFRQQGDIKRSFSAFELMRKSGIKPDPVAYTVLLSLLATLQDCDTADKLYMQAVQEDGVVPDDEMMNALMNVHVEAGSWKETIRLFHHLTDLPSNKQPPIDTYNSLLKAYVLIGAPFRLMSKLFFKLQDIGGKPDTYTFAILIQSAVDSNQLDIACEIYEETKRREEETGQRNLVSQHILTILMSAYLRQQKMDRAKQLFDEMNDRGLQPTSVTFGAIIKAYGRQAWEERMTLAEDFVKKLLVDREWERHPITKGQHLVNFYTPLLSNYAKKGDVEQVERLYDEFLEAGGRPFISFFYYLLKAYCKVGDVEKAMSVWPVIRDLAEGQIVNEDIPGKEMQTRMANIHVPLSVYLDLLSKAGIHSEVASTWSELQKEEYEFDSHNWNHLCVALVRAGHVDRAFEIVERVLLPYEKAVQSISAHVKYDRDQTVEDRLHMADGIEPPPLFPPMHSQYKRNAAASVGRKSLAINRKHDLLEDDEAIDADFSYPFSILQIISPNWNFWRPHNVVLRTLLICVLQLQRGYLVLPILPGQQSQDNVSSTEFEERSPEESGTLLEKLHTMYPATLARVRQFQAKEARRLGVLAFDRIYKRR
ncbi:hypothetical protein CPB84DRAFT_1840949 [Gymnopilus junonius]|uniref:Ig-like domain-containing protein n=1 Tax=Gymnopilus junonius TaxID=109634 RepID=A0A9P5TU25_GYMJU|nr:hypothetical protein CPB84DRAFT_1840949 [Gymnopilus junonius]